MRERENWGLAENQEAQGWMQWWPFGHSLFMKYIQKWLRAETFFTDSDRKLEMAPL